MDSLIHILIPIAFFVVWVINALMNKEAPPPARNPLTGARSGGLPPAPRPAPRDPTLRFGNQAPAAEAATPRRSVAVSDEVVILRNDQLRPRNPVAPTPRPATSPSPRRTPKVRQAPAPQAKRVENAPERPISTKVTQNVSQSLGITATQPTLTTMLGNQRPMADAEVAHLSVPMSSGLAPAANGVDFRPLFTDFVRLREAFLLNELLQPPLSRRMGRRH